MVIRCCQKFWKAKSCPFVLNSFVKFWETLLWKRVLVQQRDSHFINSSKQCKNNFKNFITSQIEIKFTIWLLISLVNKESIWNTCYLFLEIMQCYEHLHYGFCKESQNVLDLLSCWNQKGEFLNLALQHEIHKETIWLAVPPMSQSINKV